MHTHKYAGKAVQLNQSSSDQMCKKNRNQDIQDRQ